MENEFVTWDLYEKTCSLENMCAKPEDGIFFCTDSEVGGFFLEEHFCWAPFSAFTPALLEENFSQASSAL